MSALDAIGLFVAAVPAVAGIVWMAGKIVATVGVLVAARTKTKDDDEAVRSLSDALGEKPPERK